MSGLDFGDGELPDLVIDTDHVGEDAVALVVTLMRALLERAAGTADAALRALIDHLPSVLGLDPALPPIPLIDLAKRAGAFRDWLASLVPGTGDVRAAGVGDAPGRPARRAGHPPTRPPRRRASVAESRSSPARRWWS